MAGKMTNFALVERDGEPVRLEIIMPDGRTIDLQPVGEISRKEARVLCGAIMNCMRAGLRADQFRHGTVALPAPPAKEGR